MIPTHPHFRHIRSFVRRDGRMTESQRLALQTLGSKLILSLENGLLNLADVFGRTADCTIEIGFGSGYSLLEIARLHPERDFIGIETYQPGIGSLLHGIQQQGLTNIRVFYADAVEVLTKCIPEASLAGVQIFFSDPWPKRRHHKRRLIQPPFVQLIAEKLKPKGVFHLATDLEHYALHMLAVLSAAGPFINLAGAQQFASRSDLRPVTTKFEQRGTQSGRRTWELQFAKQGS